MTTIQDRIIKQLDNNKNLFDWQKPELKQFLSDTIDMAERDKKQEVLKDVKKRMEIAFKFIPDKKAVEYLTDVLNLQLSIIEKSD